MDTRELRFTIAEWGMLALGLGAGLIAVVRSGALTIVLLFGLIALMGGVSIAGHRQYVYYLMTFVGAFALLIGAVSYRRDATASATLFGAVGVVMLVKGVRAIRVLR